MAPIRLSKELCVALAFPRLAGAAPLRVYCALRLHGKNARPSLQTLAHSLGLSSRSVEKALEQLVKVGLLVSALPPQKGVVTTWHFLDWTDEDLKQLALVLDWEKKADYGIYVVGSLVPGNDKVHEIPTRGRRRADAWWNARLEHPRAETQKLYDAAFKDSPEMKEWSTGDEGAEKVKVLRKRYTEYLMARAMQRFADAGFESKENPAAYLQTILSDIETKADPAVEGAWQEEPLVPPVRAQAGRGGRPRQKDDKPPEADDDHVTIPEAREADPVVHSSQESSEELSTC